MVGSWVKLLLGGVKVFVATICLAVASFFAMFAVFLPLIHEHRLVSYRFSAWYVWNFFYGLSLYFIIVACLAVITYLFIRSARPEVKIFVITFLTAFTGYIGTKASSSCYWGSPLPPFFVIIMWQGWLAGVIYTLLSLYLLAVSAFVVLAYRVYKSVHGTPKVFLSLLVATLLSAFICISVLIPIVSLGLLLLEALFSYCIALTIAAVFNKPLRETLEKGRQKM